MRKQERGKINESEEKKRNENEDEDEDGIKTKKKKRKSTRFAAHFGNEKRETRTRR